MFWIGCRVKKVHGEVPENIGAEGVVVGLELMPPGTRTGKFELDHQADIQVVFDRDMVAVITQEIWLGSTRVRSSELKHILPAGTMVPELRSNLVPILPEGLESEDETNALYEPEKVPA